MAPVRTKEVSNVSMQDLIDAGLNGFALELLVESYANPRRLGELPRITVVWRGVKVTLEEYDGPVPKDGGA